MAIDESVTKEQSLAAIKSWFDDEYPTAEEVNKGDHAYARGMVDLHLSLFAYDGDLDMDELRVIVWEEIFPTPVDTYPFTPGIPVSIDDIAARIAYERGVGIGSAETYQAYIRTAELVAEVVAHGSKVVRLTDAGLVDAATGVAV